MSHVREELGAYVLGVLEPAERRSVEAHLAGCADCRDELAQLASLRPLLDRLTPEEAVDERLVPSASLSPRVVLTAAATAGELRRELRRWRWASAASAAAAVVVLLVSWAPWDVAPSVPTFPVTPVAADASDVGGTVAAHAWEWGTTLELEVWALPTRPAYQVWAVADDGRRERAGTWGPTHDRDAQVRAATAILREHLTSVEVTDPDGTVLFAASLPSDDRGA